MASICIPPRKYIGKTVEAQPGKALSVKNFVIKIQTLMSDVNMNTIKPSHEMSLSGKFENEVIPCQAKDNIFLRGYFDSPAALSERLYSLMSESYPIRGIIPLKNKLTSSKQSPLCCCSSKFFCWDTIAAAA